MQGSAELFPPLFCFVVVKEWSYVTIHFSRLLLELSVEVSEDPLCYCAPCVAVHSVNDHTIMSSGRKNVQMFASLAANLCQHAVGHCVPMSAYILPQLASESSQDVLKLSESQGSWFGMNYLHYWSEYSFILLHITASIFVVGCLTGSLVGGYQCEHLGRRKSMMLDSVLMLAGFVCQAMAPNVEVFLLGELRVLVTSASTLVLQEDFWRVTAPEVTLCPVQYLWVRSHTRTCGGPPVWWPWSVTHQASSWACWQGPPCPGGRPPGCLSPLPCYHLASCCSAG